MRVSLVLMWPIAFVVALAGETFRLLARANEFVLMNRKVLIKAARGAVEVLSYPIFGIAKELGGFYGILWLVLLAVVFAAILAAVPWVRWLVEAAILAGVLVIVPGPAKWCVTLCDRFLDLWEQFAEWVAAKAKGEARA